MGGLLKKLVKGNAVENSTKVDDIEKFVEKHCTIADFSYLEAFLILLLFFILLKIKS